MFRYLILGLLRDGEARHGYALMKEYRERSGIRVSAGNFYRELQRLVGEGHVQVEANPSDADPRRAPYAITLAGAAAFDLWLRQPMTAAATTYEDEISCRALFIADAGREVVEHILQGWQDDLWLRAKVLERERGAALARQRANGPVRFDALDLLMARRLKHVAADLEFVEEFRAAYETACAADPGAAVTAVAEDTPIAVLPRRRRVHKQPPRGPRR